MADAFVPITAGVGTAIDTYQVTGGDHQQVVREARATALVATTWNVSVAGTNNILAADSSRLMVTMVNYSTGRVYIDFDATVPLNNLVAHWYLESGERYEVPIYFVTQPISMKGEIASNAVILLSATAG